MAAVAGGRVQVAGSRPASAQGDAAFADLLGGWAARSTTTSTGIASRRDPARPLAGIDVDMADMSDLVPTLAAVAVTAARRRRSRASASSGPRRATASVTWPPS